MIASPTPHAPSRCQAKGQSCWEPDDCEAFRDAGVASPCDPQPPTGDNRGQSFQDAPHFKEIRYQDNTIHVQRNLRPFINMLREAPHGSLTMATIGCLPDNVQKAILSFSIRPGCQHITFCFPFMADLIQGCQGLPTSGNEAMTSYPGLTPCFFCDQSIEVISGYQSFATLAPQRNRNGLPVVLFTLYQSNTKEGLRRHFEQLVKLLQPPNTPTLNWVLPHIATDLPPNITEQVIDTCVQTILETSGHIANVSSAQESKENINQAVKDTIVGPSFQTYEEQLEFHIQEVATSLPDTEQEGFLRMLDHIRSPASSYMDFHNADLLMRSSSASPLVREFWHIWSQVQLASKVFPLAMAGRNNTASKLSPWACTALPMGSLEHAYMQVPIKEGLQSIIKGLKAQDQGQLCGPSRPLLTKGYSACNCGACKVAAAKARTKSQDSHAGGFEEVSWPHAANRMPPGEKAARPGSSTPYSDALKAVAVYPTQTRPFFFGPTIEQEQGQFGYSPVYHQSSLTTLLPNDPYWFRLVPGYSALYFQPRRYALYHPVACRPDSWMMSRDDVEHTPST